jgi:hypothetical protein
MTTTTAAAAAATNNKDKKTTITKLIKNYLKNLGNNFLGHTTRTRKQQ